MSPQPFDRDRLHRLFDEVATELQTRNVPCGYRWKPLFLGLAVELRPKESHSRLQNFVGPLQLLVFPSEINCLPDKALKVQIVNTDHMIENVRRKASAEPNIPPNAHENQTVKNRNPT